MYCFNLKSNYSLLIIGKFHPQTEKQIYYRAYSIYVINNFYQNCCNEIIPLSFKNFSSIASTSAIFYHEELTEDIKKKLLDHLETGIEVISTRLSDVIVNFSVTHIYMC